MNNMAVPVKTPELVTAKSRVQDAWGVEVKPDSVTLLTEVEAHKLPETKVTTAG